MTAVNDIAYVRYQVTDLAAMEGFLVDFGLHVAAKTDKVLYMRAAGDRHHCHVSELGTENKTLGFGLVAQSLEDLQSVSRKLGVAIEDVAEPGGGQRVRVVEPSGFEVDVIFGQAKVPELAQREPVMINPVVGRKRLGQTVRLTSAPCCVARLGHVALLVRNFAESYKFFTEILGFKPSDSYWAGVPENKIAAFMHCGLGKAYTDHHTVALITAQDGISRFDHSAYEVIDLDDLMQGHAPLGTQPTHRGCWKLRDH